MVNNYLDELADYFRRCQISETPDNEGIVEWDEIDPGKRLVYRRGTDKLLKKFVEEYIEIVEQYGIPETLSPTDDLGLYVSVINMKGDYED